MDMDTVGAEIIFNAKECKRAGLSRESLEEVLASSGVHFEVAGSDDDAGQWVIAVEFEEKQTERAIAEIKRIVQAAKAPPSTMIKVPSSDGEAYSIHLC